MPPIVNADVPCTKCGYNLRTLPADHVCPECATPVAQSLEQALLHTGKLYFERLAGLFTLQVILQSAAIAVTAANAVGLCGVRDGMFIFIPAMFLGHYALGWALTSAPSGDRAGRLARLIRWCILPLCIGLVLTFCLSALGFADTAPGLALVFGALALVIASPPAFSICKGHFVARLCRGTSQKHLAPWTIAVSYAFAAGIFILLFSLAYFPVVSRRPQPLRDLCAFTGIVVSALGYFAGTVMYFLLARGFKTIAAAAQKNEPLTTEASDAASAPR